MKTLLVLGAGGLVGSHAAPYLKQKYDRLIGVDEQGIRSEFYDIKLNCSIDLGLNVGGESGVVDCLILAAARTDWGTSKAEYVRCNVSMMEAYIEWHKSLPVSQRPRTLLVSSIAVYGESNYIETAEPMPNQVYGQTKYLGEKLLQEYCDKTGSEFFIVRPAAIYGATDISVIGIDRWLDNNTVRMIRAIDRNRFFLIHGHDGRKSLANLDDFSYFLSEVLSLRDWRECDTNVLNFADRGGATAGQLALLAGSLLDRKVISVPYCIAFVGCFLGSLLSVVGVHVPYTLKRLKTFGSSTEASTSLLIKFRAVHKMRNSVEMIDGFSAFVEDVRRLG